MINIISAVAKNGVIGDRGKIPWNIPEDMKHFKSLTTGNILVMGRKTYESIGFPLPDRYTIVVSDSRNFSGENVCTVNSLEKAVQTACKYDKNIFLCGGAGIYSEGLNYAQRLYITELYDSFQGDTCFPSFSREKFVLKSRTQREDLRLDFCIYEKQGVNF